MGEDAPSDAAGEQARPPRALVAVTVEFRLLAACSIIAAVPVSAIVFATEPVGFAAVRLVVVVAFFGLAMYFFGYRQLARMVVEEAPLPPTTAREEPAHTRLRVLGVTAVQVAVLLALSLLLRNVVIAAGVLLANGLVLLRVASEVATWSRVSGGRLWRESRWRFAGTLDLRDFSVEPPLQLPD